MSKPDPLTANKLNRVERCGCAGCLGKLDDRFYFLARCHPESSLEICFSKKTGLLTVECGFCKQVICEIKPAQ